MANTFKNVKAQLVGTTSPGTTIYTCPASTQTTVIGMTVANVKGPTAVDVQVDVLVFDGNYDTYLVKNALILRGSSMVVVGGDQKLVLMPGDVLKVKSSVVQGVDVLVSLLEIT